MRPLIYTIDPIFAAFRTLLYSAKKYPKIWILQWFSFFLSNLFFTFSLLLVPILVQFTRFYILTRFSYPLAFFFSRYTRAFELNISLNFNVSFPTLQRKHISKTSRILTLTFRMISQKYSSWAKHSYVSTILRVYV